MLVGIACPEAHVLSETFIQAHVERLPAETLLIYGGQYDFGMPRYFGAGQSIQPTPSPVVRAWQALKRRALRLPDDHFEQQALAKLLARKGVAVVMAEFGPTGAAMLGPCRQTRIPLVVHFHGYDAYRSSVLAKAGQRYNHLFDYASAIIAVSKEMEQQLIRLGARRDRVHYNACGVDLHAFDGAEPGLAPPLFVTAGRFVLKKAPYLTLLAFKKVAAAVPEARLLMIGDGPLWEVCARMVQVWKMGDRVNLVGAQPHKAVAATLRGARAFVQHSVRAHDGDAEGTPVAILEAAASGLPVIATRHAGIKEAVHDGQTGYLVDEGDVDSMAAYMIELARQPALAADMGIAGRAHMQAHFSMEGSIAGLWRILQAAAGNR